jgi:RNA polymerase sigma-70 factor (ECF subfamily)
MTDHKRCLEIKEACEITFKHKYNIKDEDVIYDAMASIILQFYKNQTTILNFRSWLFGAIHHHFSSFVRNKKKESIFVFDEFILESYESAEYPETCVDIEFVKIKIEELDTPFKEILHLRLLENRTHKEIAEHLDLNPASVRKYYSRAIERISKKIKLSVTLLVLNLQLR